MAKARDVRSAAFALLFVLAALLSQAASVTITWQDNADNEDKQRVYRGLGPTGALLALAEVGANVERHEDTTVIAGATYRYQVSALNTAGESERSNIATVTLPPAPTLPAAPDSIEVQIPGNLVNVSTRGMVTGADSTLIPGFVVSDGPVRVLVRVVGPRLADFGVPDEVCDDPRFELRNQQSGAVIAANDNWSGAEVSAAAQALFAFSLPVGGKDAALVVTLQPGIYTIVARSNAGDGIALAEVYKLP